MIVGLKEPMWLMCFGFLQYFFRFDLPQSKTLGSQASNHSHNVLDSASTSRHRTQYGQQHAILAETPPGAGPGITETY